MDGSQHLENKDYDTERDSYLLMHDIKVLRFWNREISVKIDEVLEKIKSELTSSSP